MLLERHDEWPEGTEARSERAVVKMVVDNGPAQVTGALRRFGAHRPYVHDAETAANTRCSNRYSARVYTFHM